MYVGLTVVFALLWCSIPARVLAEAAAVCAGICAIGAVAALPGTIKGWRDSRYDLESLRKLHDKVELERISLEENEEFDSVHCLRCGEVYSARLPLCPRCGSAQGA
jgi:hypothetical protein